MRNYFSRKMGFGRYPERTISEVFSNDRRYFDQILYKNARFRAEYAQALQGWIRELEQSGITHNQIFLNRVLLAVELMGEEKVKKLFNQLISYLNEEWSAHKLPENLDYKDTLDGKYVGLEGYGPQIKKIEAFWDRLAVPTVWKT